MAKDGILDSGNVLRLDPVFGGGSEERLAGILSLLGGSSIVSQSGVDGGQPNDDIGIVTTHPGLGMHTRDVEGLAGIARAVLVVLLENFVEPHKVEVDVLLQRQELLRDGIRLGLNPIDRGLIVEVATLQLVLDLLNLSP